MRKLGTLRRRHYALAACACLLAIPTLNAADLPSLIEQIRPSVVGVGSHQALRRPPNSLRGTGFVVADGNLVITNAHVVAAKLDDESREQRVVFVGRGKKPSVRIAQVIKTDRTHDLALLRFDGAPVRALRFGTTHSVREGQEIAFTGFPIGAILGLYPVTHRGIVSAITPIAIPQFSLKSASAAQLRRLRDPFDVFQLDATAYPGNSGSPVFDRATGLVIGVVNSVLVKQSKENALRDPSAITYAIPARYARALINSAAQ